jgi:hypothetical protein
MRRLSAWLDRALETEHSTRSAALLRIGLAILIFTRFGEAMMLTHQIDPIAAGLLTAFWVSTTAMLFGYRAQLATAATALTLIGGVGYLGTLHQQSAWAAHHHVYLLIAATGCVALTPSGRSYSLDRWRAIQRSAAYGEPVPKERGRVGALYLAAVQLSAVYFWGAYNKTTLGFLSGDKFESQLLAYIFDSDPPSFPGWHGLVAGASVATVLLEYALAAGLWIPALRRWLIPIGIAFHIIIYLTLPVTVFSALSCLLYLCYFDPDQVHAAIDKLSGGD